MMAWLRQRNSGKGIKAANPAAVAGAGAAARQERDSGGVVQGSYTSSSGSSGTSEAAFAEQLRRDLHPQLGNPHIIK
jgi:hypothetical protein